MTNEQIEKIEQLSYARQRNMRVNAKEVTELYNQVTGKNAKTTTCSTCLRNRISEMEQVLKKYKENEQDNKPKKNKGGRPRKEENKDGGLSQEEQREEKTETE